jgi:hypothetical protein
VWSAHAQPYQNGASLSARGGMGQGVRVHRLMGTGACPYPYELTKAAPGPASHISMISLLFAILQCEYQIAQSISLYSEGWIKEIKPDQGKNRETALHSASCTLLLQSTQRIKARLCTCIKLISSFNRSTSLSIANSFRLSGQCRWGFMAEVGKWSRKEAQCRAGGCGGLSTCCSYRRADELPASSSARGECREKF